MSKHGKKLIYYQAKQNGNSGKFIIQLPMSNQLFVRLTGKE